MTANDFSIQYAIRLPDGNLYCSPLSGAVVTWSSREGAEYVLSQLATQATMMGIANYGGSIEHRYCTPFAPVDQALAEQMIDELTKWLYQNGGQS